MSLCLGCSSCSCKPPLSPPGPGWIGRRPSWWERPISSTSNGSSTRGNHHHFLWQIAPGCCRASTPAWGNPESQNWVFRFQLNQHAHKTHWVVMYGELGKSYNDGLASDLKSSKLIFPSPSWSRSANMISLSPWVGSIYNTPTCWSSVSIHHCSDAAFDENFSLSLYTGWGPLKKHTVCVGSVTWPLLQHSGFHPNCQHHDNFLFLRKLFHKKRTFWQKILQKGSIRRKVPPRRHKVSLSKPR